MKRSLFDYLFILAPIFLLSYTQLVLKWQAAAVGGSVALEKDKLAYFLAMTFNLWTISAIFTGVCALGCWIVALAHFPISYAYPFLSLSFLMVSVGGVVLFGERMDMLRVFGLFLIMIGVSMTARGSM